MKTYPNLSAQQALTQRFVDKFNVDETLWRVLEHNRHSRRRMYKNIPPEVHTTIDLWEFAVVKPPEDCVSYVPQCGIKTCI